MIPGQARLRQSGAAQRTDEQSALLIHLLLRMLISLLVQMCPVLMKPHSSDSGAKGAAAGTELGEAVALLAKVKELEAEKAMAAATAEAKLVKD